MIKKGNGKNTSSDERVIIETYSEELSGLSSNPSMILVHKFGQRQNAYNRNIESRMQAVQSVCKRFQSEIHALQDENDILKANLKIERERNRELFECMAREIRKVKQEVNTQRLYNDLNGKNVTRLSNIIDEYLAKEKTEEEKVEEENSANDENKVKNS